MLLDLARWALLALMFLTLARVVWLFFEIRAKLPPRPRPGVPPTAISSAWALQVHEELRRELGVSPGSSRDSSASAPEADERDLIALYARVADRADPSGELRRVFAYELAELEQLARARTCLMCRWRSRFRRD